MTYIYHICERQKAAYPEDAARRYDGHPCRVVEAHMDSIFATVEFQDGTRLLVRWEELDARPDGAKAEGGVQ